MSRSLLLAAAALALAAPLGSQARNAAVSGWNGRIAFSDVTGIGSMNPDGSGQWGVELNVGDTQPAWSPDGSQLAVVTHWAGNNGILVMQPDGSGAHLVTTNSGDSGPAWSPDGSQIAFVDGPLLEAVNADGGNRHVVWDLGDPGWLGRPTWSPDGSWLAFQIQDWNTNTDVIGEVEVATGKEHTLIPAGYPSSPAFSPDGKSIAFVVEGDQIDLAAADGSSPHQLTDATLWGDTPAWSPDGSEIAFTHNDQIWVMNADGSSARQLTTGDGNTSPAWQPLGPPPGNCTLWGTAANDLLVGTNGNDVICAEAGDDTIYGLGGNDILRGDDGNDHLAGGIGSDYLSGGPGADTLDGRDGAELDTLDGGPGADTGYVDGQDRVGSIAHVIRDPDLAAWRPATASGFEPTNPPVEAVDGVDSDWWNSGNYPVQWLEVDLGRPVSIARVRLIATEIRAGDAVLLLGRSTPDVPFHLLHSFAGPAADNELVSFAPKKPWRNVRYVRLYISGAGGWAAWHELSVYAPKRKK